MQGDLIVSTYPPRKCGIANFSSDLRTGLLENGHQIWVASISDASSSYDYPPEVGFQIRQEEKADYADCADWANKNSRVDTVIIQHEYGIFGGPDGDYILELTARLTKPFLLVAHTVLPHPSPGQFSVLRQLIEASQRVICMTDRSRQLLMSVYRTPPDKISIVPHGVPDFVPQDRDSLKKKHSLSGRRVITTFGFIGPGKGLDVGIQALSWVVQKHPEALYIIAGKTHPVLLRRQGEEYRHMIEDMVIERWLQTNVIFEDRYLTIEEIGEYLYMTDIYFSPYPNPDQAVSGPLSYAIGCGRAVVATPYGHALEMLRDGNGLIARDMSAEALAEQLEKILDNPGLQTELERRAGLISKSLSWAGVARRYHEIIEEVTGS